MLTKKGMARERERLHAQAVLDICGIPLGADFDQLKAHQLTALRETANAASFIRPKGYRGERARYWHDLVQRRAR